MTYLSWKTFNSFNIQTLSIFTSVITDKIIYVLIGGKFWDKIDGSVIMEVVIECGDIGMFKE